MPHDKQTKFEKSLSRFYTVTTVVIISILTATFFITAITSLIATRVSTARDYEKFVEKQFDERVSDVIADLGVLNNLPETRGFIENPYDEEIRQNLELVFSEYLKNDERYLQLRLINTDGYEVIRLNSNDGSIDIVQKEQLQYKGDSYYHQDIMKQLDGQYYISRIDLNREHGVIEFPYKAVLRIAVPVKTGNDAFGYLIANTKADEIIQEVTGNREGVSLVSSAGYYLYNQNKSLLFGDSNNLGTDKNFFNDISSATRNSILSNDEGTEFSGMSVYVYNRTLNGIQTQYKPILVNQIHVVELLAPYIGLIIVFVFVTIASILTVKKLAKKQVKEFVKPIMQLVGIITEITKGNYKLQMPSTRFVEFNNILSGVEKLKNTLEEHEHEISRKIEEQTKDIKQKLETINKQKEEIQIFAEAVEKTANGVFLTDLEGKVTYANTKMEAITGFTIKEIVGKKAGSLWGGKMPKDFYKKMWHTIKDEKRQFKDILTGTRKNGEAVHYELDVSPILDEKTQKIKYFLAIQNDITKGIENEKLRTTQIKQYEEAFNNSSIGVALVGLDGSWLKVNDALVNIVGYPREKLLKLTFRDITHPDDLQKDLELIEKTIKGEINGYRIEKRYIREDGKTIWILLTVSVITNGKGQPQYFISQIQDIEERKAFEEQLIESNETKSKFISIVSHQMRTPISSIRWNLEAMLNGDFGEVKPEHKEILRAIFDAETLIVERLNDLLSVMDIDENKISIRAQRVSISTILETVLAKYANSMKNKNLRLESNISTIKEFDMDRDKILKVFEILIANAVDYNEEEGLIKIDLLKNGKNVKCIVENTGLKILGKEKTKVFTKFFRATNATTVETDRSGVGLYIAKHYVELHGGKMGFSSKKNENTKFWFEIPISKKEDTAVTSLL